MGTQAGFSTPIGSELISGDVAGEHVLQGNLSPGDTLLAVDHVVDGTPPTRADLTGEFSITAGKQATIENTTTDTTGGFLNVLWAKAE